MHREKTSYHRKEMMLEMCLALMQGICMSFPSFLLYFLVLEVWQTSFSSKYYQVMVYKSLWYDEFIFLGFQ